MLMVEGRNPKYDWLWEMKQIFFGCREAEENETDINWVKGLRG